MTVYGQPRQLLMTGPSVAAVAAAAGWKGDDVVTAVAIAYAETGGSLDAHSVGDINLTETGEQSTGLWQVNYRPSRDAASSARQPAANMDPLANARNAYGISGGGTNWRPWSTYTSGAYRTYLDKARAAVAASRGLPVLSSTTLTGGTSPVASVAPLPAAPTLDSAVLQTLIAGYVDLTTTKVSELSLEFIDDDLRMLGGGTFGLGGAFTHEGIAWTVTYVGLAPYRGTIPKLIVRASPSGVAQMRLTTPPALSGISATDYMRQVAAAAGLGFVGQDSPTLGQIGPGQVPNNAPDAAPGSTMLETGWDIGTRLAKDLAKTQPWLAFEAGGTYFFGVPQYLANHTPNVELSYKGISRGEAGVTSIPMLAVPTCEATRTQSIGRQVIPRGVHVRATVDRDAGKKLRPGMRAALSGIPVFGDDHLLTHVRWDLVPDTGPVTVEGTDFPPIPGIGEIGTLILAGGPQVVDTHPPKSGSYFQADRLSGDAERIRIYGQPNDSVRWTDYHTPWGINTLVHDLIAAQFKAACELAAKRSTWVPKRIDSIHVAKIPGTNSWSLHSFALAWDFFSSPPDVVPPGGVVSPISAPDQPFADAFKALGFYLGREFKHTGGYGTGGDWPHIEWASAPPTPAQVQARGA